jgi:ABC-2 type transport system permease protein
VKQFLSFVIKEFHHISRDRRTLFILLGMPLVQILIFGFALTNEVKNSGLVIVDPTPDATTRTLTDQFEASRYFEIQAVLKNRAAVETAFRKGLMKLAIVFPPNFGEDLSHFHHAQIQLLADASDPNVANTLMNYASAIIYDYQDRLWEERQLPYRITTAQRMLYNPQLKGAYNFVPGVMAMVLLLVCTMMTAITIVKEKELGTMEVMLVSPVRPLLVVLAKAVPYLILSIVNISCILVLSVFVLEVPIQGSLPLLFFASILFIGVSLSLGLLISAATSAQQTAMFISLVALFLPTIMLSGFMFPIENMPLPLRLISNIVPAKWYFFIVKAVMIKGVGVASIWRELVILHGMLGALLFLAVKKFKTRLA